MKININTIYKSLVRKNTKNEMCFKVWKCLLSY